MGPAMTSYDQLNPWGRHGRPPGEVTYLRKNVEHLRFAKRRLEEKVQDPHGPAPSRGVSIHNLIS